MRRVVSSSLLVAFGAVLVLIPTSCAIFKLFPRTVVVQAADDWLATGVNVDIGDLLRISATGEISYSPLYPVTGPNGDATVGTPAEADPIRCRTNS